MIDHNVCDAARFFDQEQPIGPLEDAVLGALEAHDEAYANACNTEHELRDCYQRVVAAWLYPGAIVDLNTRAYGAAPRCILRIHVASGNARNVRQFRVVGEPRVNVHASGDPVLSEWTVKAVPISSKTGREMSGNALNRTGNDGSITLSGPVFMQDFEPNLRGDELVQHERDSFIRMVAEAEKILVERASAPAAIDKMGGGV